MPGLLYTDLVSWYRMVDPVADHRDEAAAYEAAFLRACPHAETLLDLGSGAGHNAFHLKRRYRCTLTDLSGGMLSLSRELNPDCEHIQGDMRSLRLDRTFDAVLVHDAVMYMTTEADLRAAVATASAHTKPGGAALFAPDFVRETFRENTEELQGNEGERSLRCLAWTWDPEPADSTYRVDYAFLLRDRGNLNVVHDQHVEGLFSRGTWQRVLTSAGFNVETVQRPIGNDEVDEVFLCRRSERE
jgi:SAM-dependent methyltransferase